MKTLSLGHNAHTYIVKRIDPDGWIERAAVA